MQLFFVFQLYVEGVCRVQRYLSLAVNAAPLKTERRITMDYSIYKEELLNISDGTARVRAELIASSSEKVPYFTDPGGRMLSAGSVALVPSEGRVYILDTDLLWTDWGSGEKLPAPEDPDESEEA